MGRNRFVAPEVVRVPLSEGDWLDVKKRLTTGEMRKAAASMATGALRVDGTPVMNIEMIGKADVCAYVVGWSLCDDHGQPVPFSVDALDALDILDYTEIETAVKAHHEAQEQAVKKSRGVEIGSAAILTSVA